jgi:hypothetical protein
VGLANVNAGATIPSGQYAGVLGVGYDVAGVNGYTTTGGNQGVLGVFNNNGTETSGSHGVEGGDPVFPHSYFSTSIEHGA